MVVDPALGKRLPDLRLLLPIPGGDQELFIPAALVSQVMFPSVEHEVGHIVAAAHHGAYVMGIGVGFIRKPTRRGLFFQAIYGWESCPTNIQCLVKAAGPAADLLYRGTIDESGASGDLTDIEILSGVRSLEPYLSDAQRLLSGYANEISWIAQRVKCALADGSWRRMVELPNGSHAAFLIDEAELSRCP